MYTQDHSSQGKMECKKGNGSRNLALKSCIEARSYFFCPRKEYNKANGTGVENKQDNRSCGCNEECNIDHYVSPIQVRSK